ncbi:uncharacterized protein LOC119584602 [Penaeus monodon]|uniref:uncharacterized protein LOC119584602 n=1 Tax=Penaeus monodon TaxID=6687 RepID=UPI0018A73893|nr:uncharacterized protein LOC119584602 [Penaeus monodon]
MTLRQYKTGASNHVPDLLSRPAGDVPPSMKTARLLEQAQEAHDDAADKMDLTGMTAVQTREHQLWDPACEDPLGWLEGRQAVPGERPPAALFSFEALRQAHCPPTATHPGVHHTFQNLQGAWYFPNMYHLVREYVAASHACQQRKGVAGRAPMEGHPLPEVPLVTVSADLMDLRGSAACTLHCEPSHMVQLVSLLDKKADRVLWAFDDHYSNGVVERTNQTVKDALVALARQAPSQWPTHLPAVRLALNSSIHRAVRDQPLYLLTGLMVLFGKGLINRQAVDPNLILARLADACWLGVEVSRKMQETNKAQYEHVPQAHTRRDLWSYIRS